MVSDGLYRQEVSTNEPEIIIGNPMKVKTKNNEIITTDDELKSFDYVKEMLARFGRNVDQLEYKDTVGYFSINVSNINNWFIRLNLDSPNKNFATRIGPDILEKYCNGFKIEAAPKGMGESRIYINSFEDIKELANLITYCYDKMCLKEGIDKISGLKKA